MRILILSDTHGNYQLAVQAIGEHSNCDQIIHLGDDIDDAFMIEQILGRPVIKIAGNCDYTAKSPRERLLRLTEATIFLTHGDKYFVKSGLSLLHKKALSKRAQIVLYGHSHRAAIDTVEGILFVNPGCMNRGTAAPSCAVLTLNGVETSAEIVYVNQTPDQM